MEYPTNTDFLEGVDCPNIEDLPPLDDVDDSALDKALDELPQLEVDPAALDNLLDELDDPLTLALEETSRTLEAWTREITE